MSSLAIGHGEAEPATTRLRDYQFQEGREGRQGGWSGEWGGREGGREGGEGGREGDELARISDRMNLLKSLSTITLQK